MAMSKPRLERMIQGIREDLLRQPVSKADRERIAERITQWQTIAPFLDLTEAEEEEIEGSGRVPIQRRTMLKIWSNRFQENATYMKLIEIFWNQDRLDLAEVVCDVLRKQQNAPPPAPPVQPPTHQVLIRPNGEPHSGASIGHLNGASVTNTAPNNTTRFPPSRNGDTFTQPPQAHHQPAPYPGLPNTSSNSLQQARVAPDHSVPLPSLKPGKDPSTPLVNQGEGVFFSSDYTPNTDMKLFCSPSDKFTFSSSYWGLPILGYDGEGTVAAVIDTGICVHTAFLQCVNKNGNVYPKILFAKNFTVDPPDDNFNDVNGHGSRSAGILAGLPYQGAFDVNDRNNKGVFPGGIAPAAQLIICRTAHDPASFSIQACINALDWLIQIQSEGRCKVDVVSMSFGGTGYRRNEELEKRIRILNQNHGTICVAAGSNTGRTLSEAKSICYPAKFEGVICVGAHDSYGNRAPFSPKGAEMEFLAPGKCIGAPVPAHTHALSCGDGTSSAAPAIAGLVCLLIQMAKRAGPPSSEYISRVEIMRTLLIEMSNTKDRNSEYGYGSLTPSKWLKKQIDLKLEEFAWIIKDNLQ